MTTSRPQLEVLNEIQALFNWNPPRLISTSTPSNTKPTTASTISRPTAFYDKHFSSDLVLERIERLPSLVQDLARNVDTALQAALNTLPHLYGFITTKQRAIYTRNLDEIVTDETGVASFYDKTTARFCSPLASTLALHPTASFSQWCSLLLWTRSPHPSCCTDMDGLLRFIGEGVDEETKALRAAIVAGMESEDRHIFEKIRKSMWPLATWEMRSTSTGPREVMTAVPTLGEFSWTICNVPDCVEDSKEKRKKVTAAVGPDAQDPPWRFPERPLKFSLDLESSGEAVDILLPLSKPLLATPQRPATRQVPRSAAASGFSMFPSPLSSGSSASERVSPTKDKGKKRKRDGDDEDYQDRHDLTAQSLVQQAWAHAVRVDGTIIIIHSGNYELVCIRNRTSRTLYVSDLIEPPTCTNPGYGKLQVGIYIAAIQDAMDRYKQLAAMSLPKSSGGSDFISGDKDQENRDHNWGSGGRRDRRGRCEGGHREHGCRSANKHKRFMTESMFLDI